MQYDDRQFVQLTVALLDSALDRCRNLIHERRAVQVWEKSRTDGGTEVVSELDEAIEHLLVGAIQKEYCDAPIVGEEAHADFTLLDRELCFVIDPIDGTREFVSGRTGFCISVALLRQRKPVLGVLDFPARRQRFWAQRGFGASLNRRRLHVAREPEQQGLHVAVSPTQERHPRFDSVRRNLNGLRLSPVGALAAKLVGVAQGFYDAAFFLDWEGSRAPIWDFAAAGLLLHEAGGVFTSLNGLNLLDIMPDVHHGGWLATNGHCHKQLLALLRRVG